MLHTFAFALSFFFLMTGCARDNDIQTYRVPKETPVTTPRLSKNTSQKEIEWQTPPGWEEQTPSAMRLGSFLLKGTGGGIADVSVIALSGQAGGLLANINRWRGQIGLGPLTEKNLPTKIETLAPAERPMQWVDFENQGMRISAAIYARPGRTWFFKMAGDDQTVRDAKPAFLRFLAGLRFNETP